MSSEAEEQDFDKSADEGFEGLGASLFGSLRQGRWWFAAAAVAATVGMSFLSLRMPDQFRSIATIGVIEQQVSERVVAADQRPIDEMVASMTRQILSRPSLLQIVDELNLYPKERAE